ncbi:MAG: hypothetical protein IKY83_12100 [Proteobacteria bacterium]|nr:hypothetical protein [Pseudomonadota bacterium]
MNDSNQCLLGLDKLQEKHFTMLRPVCLFYKMKSIFPKHIKSWLGVFAAICGVCAKKAPDVMSNLASQFIRSGVFEFKSPSSTEIQLENIPYTEYKLSINNIENLSNAFNICRRICRNSSIILSDFFAVCEYPDDVPLEELIDYEFDFEDNELNDTSHNIANKKLTDEQLSPEGKLLRAIFGEKENDVDTKTKESKLNSINNPINNQIASYTLKQLFGSDEEYLAKRIPNSITYNIETNLIQKISFPKSTQWSVIAAHILAYVFHNAPHEFKDFQKSYSILYEDETTKVPVSDIITKRQTQSNSEDNYIIIPNTKFYLNADYLDSLLIDTTNLFT